LREDAQNLKEEKATLEGMVESHDELITKIAREIGLHRMGEDAEDEDEDEDGNNGGDVAAPLAPAPPAATPEEIIKEGPRRWFLNKKLMWHMKSSWQMLSLRCCSPVSTTRS
jgi:hypothetical protein